MRDAPTIFALPPAGCEPAAREPTPRIPVAQVLAQVFDRATSVDAAARFPSADIAALVAAGLVDPVSRSVDELRELLTAVGRASLTVGRLFEGHINAARLVERFGGGGSIIADEAAAGRISGVWNAERGGGLVAREVDGGWRLDGRKIHCSGAGSIRRPIVTARTGDDVRMFLPDIDDPAVAVDLSVWRAAGMRGTATGTVDFDGLFVPRDAVVGGPGDYYCSPWFSGGAWRVIAVQLGGLDRVMELHAERLAASGRDRDPVIRARFAHAAAGHEAARLLVAEASRRAEAGRGDPAAIDAYVDLARSGFEDFALTIIAATRRNVGLGTFIAPDPLDRVLRDLETYLRQPFLDASRDNAAAWLIARGGRFT